MATKLANDARNSQKVIHISQNNILHPYWNHSFFITIIILLKCVKGTFKQTP